MAQDWHAGQCLEGRVLPYTQELQKHSCICIICIVLALMQVVWKRLYADSAMDKGTLNQLKNLIHRTNVPSRPKLNMNAANDFVEMVFTSHVIILALTHTLQHAKHG